ncbi:hypothetical protein MKW94_014882, partial [Papaver nudicaule]|nr:hypothetical protein [Papaver nudicaule]
RFNENPYFENESLTKAFSFSPSGVTYIRGPSINWKEGMDITTGPRHAIFIKRGDEQKVTEYGTSFFTWFSDSEDLGERLNDEVAELIIDDLWPNAFKYFLSEESDEEKE